MNISEKIFIITEILEDIEEIVLRKAKFEKLLKEHEGAEIDGDVLMFRGVKIRKGEK